LPNVGETGSKPVGFRARVKLDAAVFADYGWPVVAP
jgi:hypothetical protein